MPAFAGTELILYASKTTLQSHVQVAAFPPWGAQLILDNICVATVAHLFETHTRLMRRKKR